MAQQLRACTALAEDPACMSGDSQPTVNPAQEHPMSLDSLYTCTHVQIPTHEHTNTWLKIKQIF